MIQVEHLEKTFTKTIKQPGFMGSVKSLFHSRKETVKAVDDISFHVDKGEILGFIGPNGYVELVGKGSYKMNVHISVILYDN